MASNLGMNLGIRILPETLRTLAFGAIGAGYTAIGTALSNPSRILYLANDTDAALVFSWDGSNDHLVLPTNGFILLDNVSDGGFTGQGTIIYVKQSGVPTSGAVYLTSFYGVKV